MSGDIHDRLEEIRNRGLYRRMRCVSGPQGPRVLLDGKPVLLLCSNNYLGLADHPRVREAAAEAAMRYGAGSGASRLISGNMTIHRRLEEQLAHFKRSEAVLLFGSGYLANAGVVSTLAREGDVVFSDALNHASIIDGCRLSRAETFVYDHCDTDHLEWVLRQAQGRGSLIVTDGVFSMDGDIAPLEAIVELAQRYDARVMVDEAHGTGAIGPDGRGAVAAAGLEDEVDVIVGTLGKALGSYGAYVCCDAEIAKYLINTARTLIFSTALPPPAVAAAMAALELLREQPRRVEKLQRNAAVLRESLDAEGLPVPDGVTQIVPVIVGDADEAVRASERALEKGIFAQAIRPADRSGRQLAAAPDGDGVAHPLGVARRGAPDREVRDVTVRRARRAPPCAGRTATATRPRASSTACATRPRRAPRQLRGVFVTGTDTEVGKSVVAASICAALAARGERVAAFKPVVTGLDEEPGEFGRDHELLASAANAGQTPDDVAPLPLRPAGLAAPRRRAGGRDHRAGASCVEAARAAGAGELVVCEGVGGLLVPITPGYLVRDLARRPRAAGGDRRAAGARHDQPLAAHGRGGPRRRAHRGRRGHDTVAGRADRDGALEPRRRSRSSVSVSVTGCRAPRRDRLAEAGAVLPVDDWL